MDVCARCWNRIPEEITQNDDFGLLEFEGWEQKITTSESRFVSATWESGNHIVTLDAVGDGDWTVSWFGESESSEQTDDWHSRYEARQFAIDQIQQMIRLIDSGMVSVGAEGEGRASEDSKGSSASSCERCGSTEGTNWVVQAGTPAGENLKLTDEESVELCDECMQEVAEATQNNINAPVVRFSKALGGKSFEQIDNPRELVRRTEGILDKMDCEVRTDFDDSAGLFFVDIADSDCVDIVEIVLDELEWYTSFCYRESEDDYERYEASYIGEFIRNATPTTGGNNV